MKTARPWRLGIHLQAEIAELERESDLVEERMRRISPELAEVSERVEACKERAVEPAPPLPDECHQIVGHVGVRNGVLREDGEQEANKTVA